MAVYRVTQSRKRTAGTSAIDTIYSTGNYSTINAGKGNDVISLSPSSSYNVIEYYTGDGNDRIYGFDSKDVFSISGSLTSSIKSGTSLILTIGSSKVTLVGVGNKSINVINSQTVSRSRSQLTTSKFNDYVSNNFERVTVNTGNGNDSVLNTGTYARISAGAGNDSVYSSGNFSTVDAGQGDDTIKISGSSVSISADKGNDSIYSSANKSTINAGDGNDRIIDYGTQNKINAGNGNDYIESRGTYSTVYADSGNDTIKNFGTRNVIYAGIGNDLMTNSANYSTVDGGTGNDRIENSGAYAFIVGGTGNDTIYSSGNTSTINAGQGNDIISIASGVKATIKYSKGDGNDKIYGFNSDDAVDITGSWSSVRSGRDVVVNVGSNKFTLIGAAQYVPNIYTATRANSSVIASSSLDSIYNSGFSRVSMNAGAGNDTVKNYGQYALIFGGAGNDSIYNSGRYSTINAGTGNDTISIDARNVTVDYLTGDGNDKIYGFDSDDVLNISGAWSSLRSGSDLVLTVGTGKLTLVGGANRSVNIKSNFRNQTASNASVSGSSGDDIISVAAGARNVTVGYNSGNGNDQIYGLGGTNVLNITDGTINSTLRSGSNIIINMNNGQSISLMGVGNRSVDLIRTRSVSRSNVTFNGGMYKDVINNTYSNVKINGGTADDSIYSSGNNVSLYGGAGNDVISVSASSRNATIGYKNGEGNDKVFGLDSNDFVNITGTWSSVRSGNDVVLTVGTGKISLMGANNKNVKIMSTRINSYVVSNKKTVSSFENWGTSFIDTIKPVILDTSNDHLTVDDLSSKYSLDTGLILADNSNQSLNLFDTSNITFGIQQKKNLL